MKQVHVECNPDELLVSKLGFTKKMVTHHQGKSRVFSALSKINHQLAMIDEDPGSVKTTNEKALNFIEESEGIKYFSDKSGNKIFVLKGKLEDWIISACRQHKILLSEFGLPEKPDDLHDVINQKLSNFEKLLDEMIAKNNPAIIKLKTWLN
jgi:hypothetical protein